MRNIDYYDDAEDAIRAYRNTYEHQHHLDSMWYAMRWLYEEHYGTKCKEKPNREQVRPSLWSSVVNFIRKTFMKEGE